MASISKSLDDLETAVNESFQSIDTLLEENKSQERVIDKQNNTIFHQNTIIEERDSKIKLLTEILEKQLSEQNSELQDYQALI